MSSLPPPSPDALAHSQKLAEHIATAIAGEGGWIAFSRYMELALYAPGLGYYAAGARKFGVDGDFVTAPEISPIFGRCIARQAMQVLEAVGGEVLELGPGSGALAGDVFDAMRSMGRAPSRYRLLEVSPDLRERQHENLARRFPGEVHRFEWIDTLPHSIRGIVIANEVLDVVPFAIVGRERGEWFERGVGLSDAGFTFEDRPLADGELKRRALAVFPAGDYEYVSEISLAGEALVRTVASAIDAGIALFIDYGFSEHEFYHPQRSMGTMRCHYRHRFHGDPFFMPGLQDITAHVDFSAMARAAEAAGAEVHGYTTQAHFLISSGLAQMLATTDDNVTIERVKSTAAAQRLVSPSEMGELFKVIAFGKGFDAPLVGFQSARPLGL